MIDKEYQRRINASITYATRKARKRREREDMLINWIIGLNNFLTRVIDAHYDSIYRNAYKKSLESKDAR
jgi:hypothetical protein